MREYDYHIYSEELIKDLEIVEDEIDLEMNTHIVRMLSGEPPYHQIDINNDFVDEFKNSVPLLKESITISFLSDMSTLGTDFYNPEDILGFIVAACDTLDFKVNEYILTLKVPDDGVTVINVNGSFVRASELSGVIAKAVLIKIVGNKTLKLLRELGMDNDFKQED